MQQHDVDDTMTRNSNQAKAWPPNTPDAPEAEDDTQQQTTPLESNTQGSGEQMSSSYEAKERFRQRSTSPTSKYQFLRDTRNNTMLKLILLCHVYLRELESLGCIVCHIFADTSVFLMLLTLCFKHW